MILKNINSLSISFLKRCSIILGITFIAFFFLSNTSSSFFKNKKPLAASLQLNKLVSHSERETGQSFYYTLQYRCASLIDDCDGVMITDALPPEVQYLSVVGSAHTVNETYNAATHTVTFEFVDPMPAGTSGEVVINVRFNLGTVPDGAVVSNAAEITADNAPSVTSNSADITARAKFEWGMDKSMGSSITLDQNYSYEIEFCKLGGYFGALNWEDVLIVDTLLSGANFVSATGGGVYDAVSHTVSWPLTDFIVSTWSGCPKFYVTINYPSSNFNIGDVVTNIVSATGTPVGESDTTLVDAAMSTIIPPGTLLDYTKSANVIESSEESPIQFTFNVRNDGNVDIDNFSILDTIPSEYFVTDLATPNTNQPYGTFTVSVFFQTNLNYSWQGLPGNPYSGSSSYPMELLLGAGEYVTVVRWDYGTIPPGFATSGAFPIRPARMEVTVNPGVVDGQIVINCADFLGESVDSILNLRNCADVEMVEPVPVVNLNKFESSGDNFIPGDTILFRLQLKNESTATGPLTNPVLVDFLPEGLEYIYHTFSPPISSPGAVTVTTTPNFGGTTRELVQFNFTGDLGVSRVWTVYMRVRVKPGTVAGTYNNIFNFLESDNSTVNYSGCLAYQDTFDLNGNLDVTETLCAADEEYIIQDIAVLESKKSVIGHLDNVYNSGSNLGNSVPGGIADYKLEVWNVSTVPITDVIVVDILPFVGDAGVVDLSTRNSKWEPYLVDTVAAPSGVTVYYSTSGNPCRSAEGLVPTGPPGCDPPVWSTTPPTDITTVQSLKFDFGSIVLNPLDTLTLTWPMRSPVNGLDGLGVLPDTITYNSFGYIGNRADNGISLLPSEGQATGTNLRPYDPAVYGDFIWEDTNVNGIQDVGEPGVDGVRVELYLDDGDGVANPAIDNFINFTVTGGGGYYIFPEIPAGNYFALAYLPSGYNPTLLNQGSDDDLDSDAIANLIGTDSVLIMPVTNILDNEIDRSWDFGITTSSAIRIISGKIFEDINYGGGDGRNYSDSDASAQSSGWNAGDIDLENVRVELYDNAGNYVSNTSTNAAGEYSFVGLVDGTYNVRAVNNTISSNRGSNGTGQTIIPVQTFRTDGITEVKNEVGGNDPSLVDATLNNTNTNLSTLTTATMTAQSVTEITVVGTDVLDVDFGFNFDAVVNINDAGQGSLRQFILNSNELGNTNLDQEDSPTNGVSFTKNPEWETSIFMIPGIGIHTIQPTTSLRSIRDPQTHVTGYTQVGSTQGTIQGRTINVELDGGGASYDGLTIFTDDVQISGFSINAFRKGVYSNNANSEGNFVWGNYIGTKSDGTTISTNSSAGVEFRTILNSYIGTNGDNINDANEGNIISNSYYGIDMRSNDNVLVAGNYIGLDKTGTVDFGNRFNGLLTSNATGTNYIGFRDDLSNNNGIHFRNVISGNGNDAIRISNSDNQIVAGNYLGTNATGTAIINNANYGVQLQGTSSNNIIGTNSNGDDDILERNIISGNGAGIRLISGGTGLNNIIAGNYIGTNVTGNIALTNNTHGIDLNFSNTTVGTNGDGVNDAVEGNVISGNINDGIRIGSGQNSIISGNKIGVGADGTTPVPNGSRGILVANNVSNNIIGYSSTMANTNELIVGNQIKYNDDAGIGISGNGINNRISRNQTEENGALGIDLDYDAVTRNDDGDGDSGPNNLMNFPVIDTSYVIGPLLTISGFAPAGAELEFFIADSGPNPNPLPGGYSTSFGEGAVYLFTAVEGSGNDVDGSTGNYVDDGTGSGTTKTQNRFQFTVNVLGAGITNSTRLTSTATDSNNNTSEFSGVTRIYLIEICDNGLDDDGDGLIDYNDPDCICCESKAPTLLLLRKE